MKKVGTIVLFALAAAIVGSWNAASTQAFPEFFKEFEKKYTKEAPGNDAEKMYKEKITTTKCGVCHQGKTKKVRNTYGAAIEKLIPEGTGKALKKDPEAFGKILDKVAEQPSDDKNPTSPSFGKLITDGGLPGKDRDIPDPPAEP
ncbi:MAG TPA: hypothetical protein VGH74_21925, partial [Planctomycetaceae bacterium]